MEAAQSVDAYTPMGAHAEALYTRFSDLGGAGKDFSAIIKMIDDSWEKPEGSGAPPLPPGVKIG
jgi:3-hydroxyisobutyrate dehydrogenase